MVEPPPDPGGLLEAGAGEKIEEKPADTGDDILTAAKPECSPTSVSDFHVTPADVYASEIFSSGEDMKETETSPVSSKMAADVEIPNPGDLAASEFEKMEQRTDNSKEDDESEDIKIVQTDTETPLDPSESVDAGREMLKPETDQNGEQAKSKVTESVQEETEIALDPGVSVQAQGEKINSQTIQNKQEAAETTKPNSEGINIPLIECGIGTLNLKPVADSSIGNTNSENKYREPASVFKPSEPGSVTTDRAETAAVWSDRATSENVDTASAHVGFDTASAHVGFDAASANVSFNTASAHVGFDTASSQVGCNDTELQVTASKVRGLEDVTDDMLFEPLPQTTLTSVAEGLVSVADKTCSSLVENILRDHSEQKEKQNAVPKTKTEEKVLHRKVYPEALGQKTMKPMTMEQIQALYYNQQLLKNPQIIEKFVQVLYGCVS